MESVNGKVVCITGASSGIGAATARLFAKYKARLALHGRNAERLEQVAQECRELGLKQEDVFTVPGDVCNEEDVRKIAAEVKGHFQTIHCLVNNAGNMGPQSKLADVPLAEVDTMMAANMKGPLLLSQLFMEELVKNKGSIVNVSSILSVVPYGASVPYCIAKAAQNHMTKCMALDLVKQGVRVNSVCPSATVTDLLYSSEWAPSSEEGRKMMEDIGKSFPMGRAAQPEEVATPSCSWPLRPHPTSPGSCCWWTGDRGSPPANKHTPTEH